MAGNNYISGVLGNISGSGLYIAGCYKWSAAPEVTTYETTAFAASSSSYALHTYSVGLNRFEGSYSCRQVTSSTTAIAGFTYQPWAYKMDVIISANILPGTIFTDAWERNAVAGLYNIEGTAETYIDDTAALPLAGESVTVLITVGTGSMTYTFTGLLDKDAAEVARDGSGRKVQLTFKNGALCDLAIAGSAPMPGVIATATLTAHTGRTYIGSIAIKSVKLSMDANRVSGDWTFDFVGNLAVTAA